MTHFNTLLIYSHTLRYTPQASTGDNKGESAKQATEYPATD